jgi:hypothetical protein
MMVQRIAAMAGVNESVVREAMAKAKQSSRRAGETGGDEAPQERYRPNGADETALACILTEPLLWEELTEAQRKLLAPALFEREIAKKLARILDGERFSAQTFRLSHVRSLTDDEAVVRAAQDFVSEVLNVQTSPDSTKRQLHMCVSKLEEQARKEAAQAELRKRLRGLRPGGEQMPPESEDFPPAAQAG